MLERNDILKLFNDINEELKIVETKGEILIVGGAVMCVVYQSRVSTKDVDGVFAPSSLLRGIISSVGNANGLADDWLNDGAKGFLVQEFNKTNVLSLSNLNVWAPDDEYMLAMKCLSARADSYDAEDIDYLISRLNIKSIDQIDSIIKKYYPEEQIPQRTFYFIEEILENKL